MNMKVLLIGIILIVAAVGGVYWFTGRVSTLSVEEAFSVEYSGSLAHTCGALTDKESLGRLGITNKVVASALETNDFSKRIWIFSNLPIGQIRHMQGSRMIFLVPTNSIPDGKLYFAAVRSVPAASVKMASAVQPAGRQN